MKKVQLSEVCDISSGGTPSRKNAEFFNGDIPWAKISDIENANNGVINDTEEHISVDGLKNIRGKLFPKGTLLFAMYGSIGKVAICGRELSTNQAILGIRPKGENEIDLDYLKTWFASNKQKLINQGRGVALKNLSATIIRDLEIELPPYNDQIRIAQLLGKVEELIAQRKQHLQQLDALLKSIFLEMFGKDIRDESSYSAITSACEFIDYRGKTPPRVDFGVPLISAKCVRKGYFDASRLDYVAEETYQKIMTRGFPAANDVLFTTEGATFGYTCRIPQNFKKFSVGQRLITMQCKAGYQPEVLEFVLNDQHIQKKLASRLSGSAALGIRSAELVKVEIPFPDPTNQLRFATIVQKVEALKSSCYQQSLSDLESLYGSLSQKAFKGELDLSQVPLPEPEQSIHDVDEAVLKPEKQVADKTLAINLPDHNILIDALTDKEKRNELFAFWLESYCQQIGNKDFSFNNFFAAAQTRISELHPEDGYGLGLEDYEQIKQWVFEALNNNHLQQAQNVIGQDELGEPILGNLIKLKTGIKP